MIAGTNQTKKNKNKTTIKYLTISKQQKQNHQIQPRDHSVNQVGGFSERRIPLCGILTINQNTINQIILHCKYYYMDKDPSVINLRAKKADFL